MTDLKKDVYTRVTDRIIADLEKGVRSWLKPWSAAHPAGSITRPAQARRKKTSSSKMPGAEGWGHPVQALARARGEVP